MIETVIYSPVEREVRNALIETEFHSGRVKRVLVSRGYSLKDISEAISFVMLNMRGDAMLYMMGKSSNKIRRQQ